MSGLLRCLHVLLGAVALRAPPERERDRCDQQISALRHKVEAFCVKLRPLLQSGAFAELTHVRDVDPRAMAASINHALEWGKRDASHGLLFAAPSRKNSPGLLLWSGATADAREKWCESLNLFMLHADGKENKQFRTPFGSLMDAEGVKDENGPLGACGWARAAPVWQSASDAVVCQNGDRLVRFLANKSLILERYPLSSTLFSRYELPTLARYPPKEGLKVLNLHKTEKCIHLMSFIRHKIQESGLLESWAKVDEFSCADLGPESVVDAPGRPFLRPGRELSKSCRLRTAVARARYQKCKDEHGELDYEALSAVAGLMPPGLVTLEDAKLPGLVKKYGAGIFQVLPDVAAMFPSSGLQELLLASRHKDHARKAGLQIRSIAPEYFAPLAQQLHEALNHTSAAVREAAAISLGQMGEAASSTTVDHLSLALTDINQKVVLAAITALGKMGGKAASYAPKLLESLGKWSLAHAASEAMSSIGAARPREIVPEMCDLLKSGSLLEKEMGSKVLLAISKSAPDLVAFFLYQALSAPSHSELRYSLALLLSKIPQGVAFLRQALRSHDADLRLAAVPAAASAAAAGAALCGALLEALRDESSAVRVAAVKALGPLRPAEVLRALDDRALEVRLEALRQLQSLPMEAHRASALPQLRQCLETTSAEERAAVLQVLQAVGPKAKPAVPQLKELMARALQLRDIQLVEELVNTLGAIADAEALQELRRAFQLAYSQEDQQVQCSALLAMGHLGPAAEPAWAELVAALEGYSAAVRRCAVQAMGELGAVALRGLPRLRPLLRDPAVRQTTLRTLGRLARLGRSGHSAVAAQLAGDPWAEDLLQELGLAAELEERTS